MKAELKAKTEALSTIERQRGQYEAMAKAKQQQLDQLAAAGKSDKEGLEAKVKDALAKAETAQGRSPAQQYQRSSSCRDGPGELR